MSDYKKRKPNYSQKNNKKGNRNFMEIGQTGYLATCNFREKDCVRECYNILDQYSNEQAEQPIAVDAIDNEENVVKQEDEEKEEIDISSQLENEVADTKKINKNRVFQGKLIYLVTTGTV